jgi:hypothetical protein
MKFFILSLFCVVLTSAAVVEDFDDVESYMNSGTLATIGEFPSAVFIEAPGVPQHTLCGGTVIDNQHVSWNLLENPSKCYFQTFFNRFSQVHNVSSTIKTNSSILSGLLSLPVITICLIHLQEDRFDVFQEFLFIKISIQLPEISIIQTIIELQSLLKH